MKKLVLFILVAAIVAPVIGCSSGGGDEKPAPVDASKDASTQKNPGAGPTETKE